MSRVSVVIPCFNAGSFLLAAVDSALAQTHADLEVIVVDDGSTDAETIEILDALERPRTRVIRQSNSGPSAARNRAVADATGEFILPLDADDLFESTYAEKAVAEMLRDPRIGIVYCDAMKFGAEAGLWCLPAYSLRELTIDNVIFCSGMYRKSDWQTVGGYNEKLRSGMEDYEFWIKIVALGRDVFKIDEPLFKYRIQESSRTTAFMKDSSVVVSTYAEIFRSNTAFFASNAEFIYEHRFGLCRELDHYRHRYATIDRWLESRGWLKAIGQYVHRCIHKLRNGRS